MKLLLIISYLLFCNCKRIPIARKTSLKKYQKEIQKNYQTVVTTVIIPKPIGEIQEHYVDILNDPTIKIVVGVGSAGTGKTLFACHAAMESLKNDQVSKIIITRPIVSVADENIGFLPGDISQKMNPWMLPIFDVFLTYFSKNELEKKIKEGVIEISPMGFMRGRTFNDCFIIAEEVQNTTPEQMFMMTTRVGNCCKLVMTGDLSQSDLRVKNGLNDFLQRTNLLEANDGIRIVEFKKNDVQRSRVVKSILKMYNCP